MKKQFLAISAFAFFTLPAFAQQPAKPDVVTLSRQTVEASARTCSELLTAFENGSLLIKELRAENADLKSVLTAKDEQIALLIAANGKLEAANATLKQANESLTKALAIAEEQHAKDAAMIAGQEKRRGKKGIVVAVLKIAGIGGATVLCGAPCGIGTAVALEAVPLVMKGKK